MSLYSGMSPVARALWMFPLNVGAWLLTDRHIGWYEEAGVRQEVRNLRWWPKGFSTNLGDVAGISPDHQHEAGHTSGGKRLIKISRRLLRHEAAGHGEDQRALSAPVFLAEYVTEWLYRVLAPWEQFMRPYAAYRALSWEVSAEKVEGSMDWAYFVLED